MLYYSVEDCWPHSNEGNVLKCADGTACNIITSPTKWACCNEHGGRSQCPSNFPFMCAAKHCADNTDYCCAYSKGTCDKKWSGLRPCASK